MYIEKLENYGKAIYVRPEDFEKSFFTSMISYYYDIKEKEKLKKFVIIFEGFEKYNVFEVE